MREQVVAQKVGNRSGIGKGRSAAAQRPAKRASGGIDWCATEIAVGLRATRAEDRRDRDHLFDCVCRLSRGGVGKFLSSSNSRDTRRGARFGR